MVVIRRRIDESKPLGQLILVDRAIRREAIFWLKILHGAEAEMASRRGPPDRASSARSNAAGTSYLEIANIQLI
jgi:hypothetical protein